MNVGEPGLEVGSPHWASSGPGGPATSSDPAVWGGGSARCAALTPPSLGSFIAVENIDSYCVLISSKAVYFLKSGDYVDREAIFLEVKYDDLYHCLVSKDHGKVYVQVTKKAVNSSSGVSIPGPSHQKPMVSAQPACLRRPGAGVSRGAEIERTPGAPLPCV